ncbi:MAG: radical SAM protein [Planctomycetota bacterium]
MSRTIVLIYPRFEPDFPDPKKRIGLPLAPLTVARPLVKAGYDVRIFDENVIPRVIDELAKCPKPVFVGFSVLGGNTVNTGRKLALQVKKLWPDVPRVWGGWSPTLLTKAYEHPTARKWVDVVVRGRGEAQGLEIARRLENGAHNFDGVPGVSWWDETGALHHEPDAPFDDATEAEQLPYHLIKDLDPYTTKYGIINYVSSYGCPHKCEFCGIPAGTQTFKPTANYRVVDNFLHFKHMGMREVIFLDDNFFTSKSRVVDMAQRLVDANAGLKWHCNGRVDQINVLSDEEMQLVAKSGCLSINVGYETGDQEVADSVQKGIGVGDIFQLADTLRRHGIGLSLNFIVGLPEETPESLVRSLESLKQIYVHQPNLQVSWYIFMPQPGTPLWDKLIARGLMPDHETLEAHGKFDTIFMEHPFLYKGPPRWLWKEWRYKSKAISWYFWTAYASPIPKNPVAKFLFMRLRAWCRWRFETRRFRFRQDWWLAYYAHWSRIHVRWACKEMTRTQPFYALWRRWRKVRPVKDPDYLPIAGIPRSF